MDAIRALLQASIDYAGLFPPAGLDMASAVQNYADYLAGSHAWALGRFVVPISRLEEFETAAGALLPRRPHGAPWRLSVLAGTDLAADVKRVGEFNCRHAADGAGAASADAIELKASSVAAIESALRATPSYVHAYVEIPIDHDPADLISAIARLGARPKVRTGGVTPDAFPSAAQLVRFIRSCERAAIAFKATAGLHHPLRGDYRLTYAPDSPRGTMFGFMNLFLAAAFLFAGMSDADAEALLEERSPDAFRLDASGIEWGNHRLGLDAIANTRERVVIAFGSCSFIEPIDDLATLGWL